MPVIDYQGDLAKAVQHFWRTRVAQQKRQGKKTRKKDAGSRGAVTGGKHADEFVGLIGRMVCDAGLSYAKRYELVCERLLRERLYDAACFFTSNAEAGLLGGFTEPNPELSLKNFAISLHARVSAFVALAGEGATKRQ